MNGRTTAGTPDYPIWALPTPLGWTLSTGDLMAATGTEIPVGAAIEWCTDDRLTYYLRVLLETAPGAEQVLIGWTQLRAYEWDGDVRP